MLASDPKCKKAVPCLLEKIHLLNKLSSSISISAVGHKFNVDESTIYFK